LGEGEEKRGKEPVRLSSIRGGGTGRTETRPKKKKGETFLLRKEGGRRRCGVNWTHQEKKKRGSSIVSWVPEREERTLAFSLEEGRGGSELLPIAVGTKEKKEGEGVAPPLDGPPTVGGRGKGGGGGKREEPAFPQNREKKKRRDGGLSFTLNKYRGRKGGEEREKKGGVGVLSSPKSPLKKKNLLLLKKKREGEEGAGKKGGEEPHPYTSEGKGVDVFSFHS